MVGRSLALGCFRGWLCGFGGALGLPGLGGWIYYRVRGLAQVRESWSVVDGDGFLCKS